MKIFILPLAVFSIATYPCFTQQVIPNVSKVESKTENKADAQKATGINRFQKITPVEKENSSELINEVSINFHVREMDLYKSNIVAKYFSHAKLDQLKARNSSSLNFIEYFFHKSFRFELLENTHAKQKEVDDFISSFDPYSVEKLRKENEDNFLNFEQAGVRVILLPRNNLPLEVRKYISKMENASAQGGRAIPVHHVKEK